MTTPETPKKPRRNELLERLNAEFAVFRDCRPLAVGIHKAIREKLPDLERGQLSAAMRTHTASTRYLKALAQGELRFDLDGQPAGAVTDEQREQAATALRERFKKIAERRRAEQEAEKARQQAEQQAEKTRQNLLKLAQKFNSR